MRCESLDTVGGDAVVLFQPDAGLQLRTVQSWFGGEHVTLFERVVPVGVQVRSFVGEQAEGVSEMMKEGAGTVLIEHVLGRLKQLAATGARPHCLFDHVECVDDGLPRLQLVISRLPID